jgi:hypothetical protein
MVALLNDEQVEFCRNLGDAGQRDQAPVET